MNKYLFLLNTLLLSNASLYSMEEASALAHLALRDSFNTTQEHTAPKKAEHLLAADALVNVLERTYQQGMSSSVLPAKSLLEAHQIALDDPQAVVQLSDKEREDLVKSYQSIYLHMAPMSPEEKKDHPLRGYKKRIYAAALKLFTSKQAAKQWLKSADCFTDEEKEIDEFASQAQKPGYCRSHYLTAKHSLTIQNNRAKETEELKKVSDALQKDSEKVDTQIAQLNLQLAHLKAQKEKQHLNKEKISKDIQATNRSVTSTTKIYDEQIRILSKMLQTHTETIKQTEQELATLKVQATNQPHKKEAEKTALKEKVDALAQLKKDQAAIKRDIDLLTNDYTITKKVLWKLSGFFTSYPVEDAAEPTLGTHDNQVPTEEKKETL